MYTEEQPGDAAVMLFIKDLREEDSGQYLCKGFYASNEEMYAEVQISTFSKFSKHFIDTVDLDIVNSHVLVDKSS